MNLVGETLKVVGSSDPTKAGLTGRVLLETSKTLVIDAGGRNVRVEKSGAAFLVVGTGKVVAGSGIAGRLEDSWGRGP